MNSADQGVEDGMEPPQGPQSYSQGSVLFNYIRAVTIAAGGYYLGYYLGIMNPLGTPLAKDVYNLKTKDEIDEFNGNVNFYFSAGTFISCFVAGILADAIGRIRLIMLTEILSFFVAYLYTIQNLPTLYFNRVLSGTVSGLMSSSVPIALAEMFPPTITGFGGLFFYLCLSGFMLLGWFSPFICGSSQVSLVAHSNIILTWPAAFEFLRFCLLAYFFKFGKIESPGFFLNKLKFDDKEEDEESDLTVSEEKDSLTQSYQTLSPENSLLGVGSGVEVAEKMRQWYATVYTEEDAERIIQDKIDKKKATQHEAKPTLSSMFSSRYRFRFLSVILINVLQQLSGINFLVVFSTNLFNRISHNGETMTLFIGAANISGGLLGLFTVERFGRRFNLMFGSLMQAVGFSLLVISSNYCIGFLSVIAVLSYMVGFGLGMGGTLSIFCAEIIPAVGNGIGNSARWITSSVVVYLGPELSTSLGPTAVLLFFIACNVFCIFFVNYSCVETKGLGRDEVEMIYLGGTTKSKLKIRNQ